MPLSRKGPGLLLRDIRKGDDPAIAAILEDIARIRPDILLLTGFDWDRGSLALTALAGQLRARGLDYPWRLALSRNAGRPSGRDMDGDGRANGPGDALGFGAFPGAGGMALLSRLPIVTDGIRDFSGFPWSALPGARAPPERGLPLSSSGHFVVPVRQGNGRPLYLLLSDPTPPVFGRGDRNLRRNADEIRFWSLFLDGALPGVAPLPEGSDFVLMGDLDADPNDGRGAGPAIRALLGHPRLQDPRPASRGAMRAARRQGGANLRQRGPPELDTADWDDGPAGPGNLRVDYVLPAAHLPVAGAGVLWPEEADSARRQLRLGLRHHLVWVDLER